MERRNSRWIALLSAACIALGCCISPNLPFGLSEQIVSAKTLTEIEAEKEELRRQQQEKQDQLDQLNQNIADEEAYQAVLIEKIDLLNAELTLIDTQLQNLNNDIYNKKVEIADLEADIIQQQADIDVSINEFKHRIRTLYIHGNDSVLSALVGATDFYDVLAKIDLINRIAKHDDEMINTLTDQLDALNASQDDLNSRMLALDLKRTETEAIRAEYDAKYQELDEAMMKTTEIKLDLERQKNDTENYIAAFQERMDSLEAESNAILEEIRQQEEENQQQQDDNDNGGSTPIITPEPGDGILAWPVPGFYYVSSEFGWRWNREHQGMDIAGAGIHHANITAAASGTVVKVVTGCSHDYGKDKSCGCGGGWGNYVRVSHGNGLQTLYAHMSNVAVSVGDTVSAGSILGYVGATGNSTGYHLHFSVIANGVYVNPRDYL